MSVTSVALILLSCLFHAIWNILTQASRNSTYLSGLKALWILLLGLAAWLVLGPPEVPDGLWPWIVASGILHGVYLLSLSRAYETQDISYVYPIARSAPALVPLFAWLFLGERLHPISFAAIAIILVAIYLLHFKGHLVEGFRNLWDAVLHRDLRWAFITLILVVAYSLVDKGGMAIFYEARPDRMLANGLVFFFLEGIIGFSLCLMYLFRQHPAGEILSSWRREWGRGMVAALATIGSYGLICVVLQVEPVSQVVAVRQVSVLMVVFWGVYKMREPFGRQRLLAAVLVVAGMALMTLDSGGSPH